MEALQAPRLSTVLTTLTTKQKTFLLHYIVSGDERAARAVTVINELTWVRWKRKPEFVYAKKLAADRVFGKSEAISEIFGSALPRVLGDVLDMAQRPWDELGRGQDKSKMWAIGLVMDIAGEKRVDRVQTNNFGDIILQLKERVRGQVVEGEYKELGGDSAAQGS